ncbi:MAG: ion transporter [Clostridiales Family XIII bacterium]|jgi:voltage-gated potassium channel|nr:ion transporter [Clostridiales Family XIII bacterium]
MVTNGKNKGGLRRRIYNLIEPQEDGGGAARLYNAVMVAAIFASIAPLVFKEEYPAFRVVDAATVALFILDYALRLLTADLKLGRGVKSFALYPVTPFAIIDLITILPGLGLLNGAFKILRLMRIVRALRVFKILRYSKNFRIVTAVIRKQARFLGSLVVFACGYVFITALVMFNVEPDRFTNFFEAVWWSVSMLTTVGYGDIYPETVGGKE